VQAVETETPVGFGSGKVELQAAPFGVGKVALVRSSHARYPTERAPQNPLFRLFLSDLLRNSALEGSR
jgi:hypothetical protein